MGVMHGDCPPVSFRRFEQGDVPACARLARDAWPARTSMGLKDQELLGMESYVQYSLESSNWTEVACTSEGIVGFLFGRIDGLPVEEAPKGPPLGEIPSVIGRFLTANRVTLGTLRLLWSLVLTELKLSLVTPRSGASIEMLIVDSRHRGKGVGSVLMDRFLKAAKDAGASLVTVYTDDLMSNWRFYENRGFRRVATFRDNITSYYSGMDARGIVFVLGIEESK